MEDFNRKLKGDFGEDIAAKELSKKGYKILDRNYKKRGGEIDIIAQTGGTVVFVEVKLRSGVENGLPCEAVDINKRRRIISTAKKYIYEKNVCGMDFRFDVIEVLKGDVIMLRHTENAFWE